MIRNVLKSTYVLSYNYYHRVEILFHPERTWMAQDWFEQSYELQIILDWTKRSLELNTSQWQCFKLWTMFYMRTCWPLKVLFTQTEEVKRRIIYSFHCSFVSTSNQTIPISQQSFPPPGYLLCRFSKRLLSKSLSKFNIISDILTVWLYIG